MELTFNRANGAVDEIIDTLMERAGEIRNPAIIREMLITALKSGQESDYPADLKLILSTMKEMRYTNKVFAPYRNRRKVTIFGSARTPPDDPVYESCLRFSRELARRGYMIITGGGPGIMRAGNEGAGSENSFAVNIRLPFEQAPNPVMSDTPRLITYKYFFNRKVAFVREAQAIAVFPGGFGTLDEAMEVFTLIQTGKTSPKPLVLIDDGKGFWDNWLTFIKQRLLGMSLISGEDFSLFTLTSDVDEAISVIEAFYRTYHSIRFVKGKLIIRLNRELEPEEIQTIETEFPELYKPGTRIITTGPLAEERDEPDLLHLPRILMNFDHHHYGLLIACIWRINSFGPAPQ
jgi:uncharacterized protein (TIGR00730 family)